MTIKEYREKDFPFFHISSLSNKDTRNHIPNISNIPQKLIRTICCIS